MFWLTGSQPFQLMKKVSESLAQKYGRNGWKRRYCMPLRKSNTFGGNDCTCWIFRIKGSKKTGGYYPKSKENI